MLNVCCNTLSNNVEIIQLIYFIWLRQFFVQQDSFLFIKEKSLENVEIDRTKNCLICALKGRFTHVIGRGPFLSSPALFRVYRYETITGPLRRRERSRLTFFATPCMIFNINFLIYNILGHFAIHPWPSSNQWQLNRYSQILLRGFNTWTLETWQVQVESK